MKLILENWRKYIIDEVKISTEDDKRIFQIDGGRITVIENSKWAGGAHSEAFKRKC